MGKKAAKAPAPDPQIGEAAKMQAQISADWLDFAKQAAVAQNDRQVGIDALTSRVTEQQLATQDRANQWAQDDRARYRHTFMPLEDQYVEEATNWGSVDRQRAAESAAKADVLRNASQQRAASTRQMTAMGVNPTSGRFAGVDRATELNTALAAAGAETNARNQVRTQGMAMKADALNIGKGLPAQAASQAGLGLSAGSAGVNTALAGNQASLAGNQIMNSGFQGAANGYANQANILNAQYGNQLNAWATQQQASSANQAGLMGGIGSFAGMFMSSSKEVKENKEPVEGALGAIRQMPVERWDYKEGEGDGGNHIGPYAEDFQAATGQGDGKTIPVVDAMGVMMKGIQELDEKVDKLASRKARKAPKRRAS